MNPLRPVHNIWSLIKDIFLPSCPKGSVGSSVKRSTNQQYLLWLIGICLAGRAGMREIRSYGLQFRRKKRKTHKTPICPAIRLAFAVICRSLFHFLHLLNPCHPGLRARTIFFGTKSTICFLAPAAIHILHYCSSLFLSSNNHKYQPSFLERLSSQGLPKYFPSLTSLL